MPDPPRTTPALLNDTAAAEHLGVSRKTLERWRANAEGPAFIRVGARSVRYALVDIEAWLNNRRVPCSEARAAGDFVSVGNVTTEP